MCYSAEFGSGSLKNYENIEFLGVNTLSTLHSWSKYSLNFSLWKRNIFLCTSIDR